MRVSESKNYDGYAFLEYESKEATDAAIAAISGTQLEKLNLRLFYSLIRPSKPSITNIFVSNYSHGIMVT